MRFLVTGGAGFIGSHLVRSLLSEGHSVRVLDDCSRGDRNRLRDCDVMFCPGSVDLIEHRPALQLACRGVDAVVHLAAVNGTRNFYEHPDRVLNVGVKGIVNVIDACIAERVEQLYVASSSEVYQTADVVPTPETVPMVIPDPYNPRYSYAASKLITEMMALHCGRGRIRRVIIFRPHNVYGPDMGYDHVIPQFAARLSHYQEHRGVLPFGIQGTGKETRSYCYISDAVRGIIRLIYSGEDYGTYNVGNQEETTSEDLARVMAEYFGLSVSIVPYELAKGSTPRRCPDVSKLALLEWAPLVGLREGIKLYLDWFIKEHPWEAK